MRVVLSIPVMMFLPLALSAPCSADSGWSQPPFKVTAITKSNSASRPEEVLPLDMADRYSTDDYDPPDYGCTDAPGHAGPFMVDLDGDGKRDLVVGGFSGKFRFYRNIGSEKEPRFG